MGVTYWVVNALLATVLVVNGLSITPSTDIGDGGIPVQPTCDFKVCPRGQICIMQSPCALDSRRPLPCTPIPTCVTFPQESQNCSTIKCDPGMVCQMQDDVNCVRFPCPQIPTCVNPQNCSTIKCDPGTVCQMQDDINCVRFPCPQVPVCMPNVTGCLTCDVVECEEGYFCEMKQLKCKVEVCPPVPACVPVKTWYPTCDTVKCSAGYVCQVQEVLCVKAPCPPIVGCVPNPQMA